MSEEDEEDEAFEHAPDCQGRVQVLIGGKPALDCCSCVLALVNDFYTSLPIRGRRADVGSFSVHITMKEKK